MVPPGHHPALHPSTGSVVFIMSGHHKRIWELTLNFRFEGEQNLVFFFELHPTKKDVLFVIDDELFDLSQGRYEDRTWVQRTWANRLYTSARDIIVSDSYKWFTVGESGFRNINLFGGEMISLFDRELITNTLARG
jgi:hypothetical protein